MASALVRLNNCSLLQDEARFTIGMLQMSPKKQIGRLPVQKHAEQAVLWWLKPCLRFTSFAAPLVETMGFCGLLSKPSLLRFFASSHASSQQDLEGRLRLWPLRAPSDFLERRLVLSAKSTVLLNLSVSAI